MLNPAQDHPIELTKEESEMRQLHRRICRVSQLKHDELTTQMELNDALILVQHIQVKLTAISKERQQAEVNLMQYLGSRSWTATPAEKGI